MREISEHLLLGGVRVACLTDRGRRRPENEDACRIEPDLGLLIVADGMGGHQAGATAAKIVVEVLPRMLAERLGRSDPGEAVLGGAISELSRRVRELSAGEAGISGMGATVVLALLAPEGVLIAHMGDSRAYSWRRGALTLLTEDHSVVEMLLRGGEITPAEAKTHPARGQLSRYVGVAWDAPADVRRLSPAPGDMLLLASDGLTRMLSEEDISGILNAERAPRDVCRRLIDAANAAGGEDNITALVAAWPEA
jgi:protein phosphatase